MPVHRLNYETLAQTAQQGPVSPLGLNLARQVLMNICVTRRFGRGYNPASVIDLVEMLDVQIVGRRKTGLLRDFQSELAKVGRRAAR